jgi:acyl-CoA thioesterase-1
MSGAIPLKTGMKILFQGDSITDCGRNRDGRGVLSLGTGYAFMIASRLAARYPELGLVFTNRGISGNRARDLEARWDADCLALAPDIVSILIGINDTWRRYDRGDATSVDAFRASYRSILEATRDRLGTTIVICEPFVLPVPPDRAAWREDLDPKIAVVRTLAREFGAVYVPFDGMFAAASTTVDPSCWAADGVHPTDAGHALMAEEWIRRVVGE